VDDSPAGVIAVTTARWQSMGKTERGMLECTNVNIVGVASSDI
jgi:hypothetical protein